MFMPFVFVVGVAFWLLGTVVLRFAGHLFLPQHSTGWVTLYVGGAALTALVARGVYRWAGIPRAAWLAAAAMLILPTLVLDAFTALFFARAFPRVDPAAGGAFGGWMLICAAGAVVGAWVRR